MLVYRLGVRQASGLIPAGYVGQEWGGGGVKHKIRVNYVVLGALTSC